MHVYWNVLDFQSLTTASLKSASRLSKRINFEKERRRSYKTNLLSAPRSSSEPITHEPSQKLLTKGDNNVADDTELYARGQDYLNREEDIVGSVRGYIPSVGYVTIMLSEHPWMKTVLLGIMGLMVILQREG